MSEACAHLQTFALIVVFLLDKVANTTCTVQTTCKTRLQFFLLCIRAFRKHLQKGLPNPIEIINPIGIIYLVPAIKL